MPESPLIAKEVAALADLEALIAARAKGEKETEVVFQRRREKEEEQFQAEARQRAARYKSEKEALEAEFQNVKAQVVKAYEQKNAAVQAELDQTIKQQEAQARSERGKAKKTHEESKWQALAMYEAGRDAAIKSKKEDDKTFAQCKADFEAIQTAAVPVIERSRKLAGPRPSATADGVTASDNSASAPQTSQVETLQDAITNADARLSALEKLVLPQFLQLQAFVWPFLILTIILIVALGLSMNNWTIGGALGGGLGVVLAIGSYFGLKAMAQPRVAKSYYPLVDSLETAERMLDQTRDWIKADFERKQTETDQTREESYKAADERLRQKTEEIEARQKQEQAERDATYPKQFAGLAARRDALLNEAEEKYPPLLRQLDETYKADAQRIKDAYDRARETTDQLYDSAWKTLITNWEEGLARVGGVATDVNEESRRRFLDWENQTLEEWEPPREVPPALPFGKVAIELGDFPQGIPVDPRLKQAGPTRLEIPALIPFPIQSSVLIKTADSGKADAIKLLQSLMLRFLTSVPPGKVRFTIFDPVGLGENFAAFMHLADYQELLVTSRIWTETQQIEQRLLDLQAHMENVIQKYLRNEFQTIEEYNSYAGEVAEPFRVLVVANFPTNISEAAARRLISIVSTGARCGVYALISMDTKLPFPPGSQLKDLETNCVNINWRDGRLQWRDSNFGRFPLTLDAPPDPGAFSQILHIVGEKARDANRVEVPFEFIAPPKDGYWTSDSRGGVEIPLGRAGATKLQPLALGKGTSQHVLIAGKTGSGKSTLLHALIVNGALRYSPDDLELYLIDFKKGVEFKVYAALELPHAKVIAVESEREFGLSVLQRLDLELKRRGDLYRDTGAQDLRSFRDARPDMPMPRILFIVDEFQEFFVEDDKISQEVSLLLDRLVRQGRAFGIHVILGSQTLGGAYSLARATLGQMAVRIALQCSEADAHLILSEDNTAARLLTRPGEAIYNDANGMVEGNNLFQVVWLSDDQREGYLEEIKQLAHDRHRAPVTPIVFEGNLPAVVSKNPLLNPLLESPTWPEAPRFEQAWLGDAIAIKDPTAAVFRPQSGSNLLIAGQNDEAALAMLIMAGIGIAAQHPPRAENGLSFYLFDGSPVDSSLSGRLGKLAEIIPHPVKNVSIRELPAVVGKIAEEVERRRDSAVEDLAPIYLMIYDIQRYRDLRKSDDDYGFSSSFGEDKPASPSKSFTTILKEGPAVGVHTIVWCDSVNNLNRTFDRGGLREFELRVLFQMSANDSSTLIDSPAAGKLGTNRALFYSEEENRTEKFRPYGLPDPAWIEQIKAKFQAKPKPEAPAPASNGHGASATETPSHDQEEEEAAPTI